jgi:hypothetical protein
MAGLASNIDQFGMSDDFNIQISGAFHQFGRHNACCAVAGGKCFVQVGHHSADGGISFNEIHFETGIGEIQRRLNTGDPAPLYQYRTGFFIFCM